MIYMHLLYMAEDNFEYTHTVKSMVGEENAEEECLSFLPVHLS